VGVLTNKCQFSSINKLLIVVLEWQCLHYVCEQNVLLMKQRETFIQMKCSHFLSRILGMVLCLAIWNVFRSTIILLCWYLSRFFRYCITCCFCIFATRNLFRTSLFLKCGVENTNEFKKSQIQAMSSTVSFLQTMVYAGSNHAYSTSEIMSLRKQEASDHWIWWLSWAMQV